MYISEMTWISMLVLICFKEIMMLYVLCFLAGVVCVLGIQGLMAIGSSTLKFVRVDPTDGGDYIMHFENEQGEKRAYRGNCTVWHTYPEGTRCGTSTEYKLSEIWTREVQWKKQ